MTNEHSPLPWCVMRFTEEDEPDRIIDANGDEVAIELLEADAALIVDAVNERDRLRDLVQRLVNQFGNLTSYEDDAAILREARAAIGEVAK